MSSTTFEGARIVLATVVTVSAIAWFAGTLIGDVLRAGVYGMKTRGLR